MWWALATTCVLFGHVALMVAIYNRLHGTALHPRVLKIVELPVAAWFLVAPVWAWWSRDSLGVSAPFSIGRVPPLIGVGYGYALFALVAGATVIARWMHARFGRLPSAVQLLECVPVANAREFVLRACATRQQGSLESAGAGPESVVRGWLSWPGNESLDLTVTHAVLTFPRLPSALNGLRIAHLSDWHFTGRVPREFFELVVERTNAWQPDLIAVTGDFIDNWSRCRDWLPMTVGRLQATGGICFLLGNHDRWCGHAEQLRADLCRLGLIDVGNRVCTRVVRGVPVLIAGNEEPWFRSAPDGTAIERAAGECAADGDERAFRLLLSHSPDSIAYARAHEFDLMLAGHTHGGQIRFPLIGPVIAPSRFGVRYASGIFHVGKTVLGVTRGLSGEEPIRWNCPPEACLWEVRRGTD